MAPNPHIVADLDGPRVLDFLPATLDFGLMSGGKNGHIRSHHDAVPDRHEPAVEDGEAEVGIEAVSDRDVTAIVEIERGFDIDAFTHVAENSGERLGTVGSQRVRVVFGSRGPGGVVSMAELADLVAGATELGREGIIADAPSA
jgi:hypothetical protein